MCCAHSCDNKGVISLISKSDCELQVTRSICFNVLSWVRLNNKEVALELYRGGGVFKPGQRHLPKTRMNG